jgi:hypothetical protein
MQFALSGTWEMQDDADQEMLEKTKKDGKGATLCKHHTHNAHRTQNTK